MKNLLLLLVALLFASLAVAACEAEDAADEADDVDEDAPDDDADAVTLDFAHIYETEAPTHACGAEELPDLLADADVGLEVEVFPNAELGSESELVEQVADDQLDMAIAGPSFLASLYEPVGLFDAAYVHEDEDDFYATAEGEVGEEIFGGLEEEAGVKVLNHWYYGARHLTANEPVSEPDDLQGMRVRFPDSEIMLATGEAMGADATAVEFEEVYTSLQQGVIDAQENPIPTINAMAFHEVQDYINLTGHIQSSTQNLISESAWDSLSDEQRDALVDALAELEDSVSSCIEQGDEELLEEWEEAGDMTINEDVDFDAFQEAALEYFSDGFEFSDLYVEAVEN